MTIKYSLLWWKFLYFIWPFLIVTSLQAHNSVPMDGPYQDGE